MSGGLTVDTGPPRSRGDCSLALKDTPIAETAWRDDRPRLVAVRGTTASEGKPSPDPAPHASRGGGRRPLHDRAAAQHAGPEDHRVTAAVRRDGRRIGVGRPGAGDREPLLYRPAGLA